MKQNKDSGILSHWQVKICCFLLAILTFFIFFYSGQTKRTITLPLEVKLPENYVAISNIPQSVDLVIRGQESKIYMIDASCFSLSADFSKVSTTGVSSVYVNIDSHLLPEYADLTDISIYTDPSWVRIYFEEK